VNRSEGQWIQPELSFPVHRGLGQPLNKEGGLGSHWSANYGVANRVAYAQLPNRGSAFYEPYNFNIIHADVPMSSVETDRNTLVRKLVHSPNNLEHNLEDEIPVKEGAAVKVTGVTAVKRKTPEYDEATGVLNEDSYERRRTRRYNPPREMRA